MDIDRPGCKLRSNAISLKQFYMFSLFHCSFRLESIIAQSLSITDYFTFLLIGKKVIEIQPFLLLWFANALCKVKIVCDSST